MDAPSKIAKRSVAGTRATRGVTIGFSILRKQLWLWPLLAAAMLAVAGLWIRQAVETAAKEDLQGELETILGTSVAALELWLENEKTNVVQIANEPDVRRAANALIRLSRLPDVDALALAQADEQVDLRKALGPVLSGSRYPGFVLANPGGMVIACDRPQLVGLEAPDPYPELFAQCLQDGASVTRPFPSTVARRDADGQSRAGLPTMFALSVQRDPTGEVIGVFGLRIRPEDDFARLLQIARPGKSGETYAFDRHGLMLSESRFTQDLIKLGIVPDQPGVRSQLNVLIRDPGVDMTSGKRPDRTRSEQPPTAMLASASQGEKGVNVAGYRDYRGVPVVGAWTWLPAYGMGITTEMDQAEAYRPLFILRRAFWGLFGLLAASSGLILVFSLAMDRMQRAAQRAALAAKELGQYQLEEKLGEGGMGVVYRGRHRMMRRPTAIKLLHPDKTTDEAIARFEREVQLTCQLNHPNTIAIYDYGRTPEGIFFYAMEYIDGINFDALIARFGPQKEGRVIRLLTQVLASLAEAHAIGLVHRDLKPANLLVSRRGGQSDIVKVLDFGLVKAVDAKREMALTSSGTVIGTPLFMSPEAVDAPESIDARSDLYAVAAVGYFLLTGTPPFEGRSVIEICMHHARTPPTPPSQRLGRPVEADVEAAILRGLAKQPGDRYPDARAFSDALLACAAASRWNGGEADAWWDAVGAANSPARSAPPTATVHQEMTVELPAGVPPR